MQQAYAFLGDLEPLGNDLLEALDALVSVDRYVELSPRRGGYAYGDAGVGVERLLLLLLRLLCPGQSNRTGDAATPRTRATVRGHGPATVPRARRRGFDVRHSGLASLAHGCCGAGFSCCCRGDRLRHLFGLFVDAQLEELITEDRWSWLCWWWCGIARLRRTFFPTYTAAAPVPAAGARERLVVA